MTPMPTRPCRFGPGSLLALSRAIYEIGEKNPALAEFLIRHHAPIQMPVAPLGNVVLGRLSSLRIHDVPALLFTHFAGTIDNASAVLNLVIGTGGTEREFLDRARQIAEAAPAGRGDGLPVGADYPVFMPHGWMPPPGLALYFHVGQREAVAMDYETMVRGGVNAGGGTIRLLKKVGLR